MPLKETKSHIIMAPHISRSRSYSYSVASTVGSLSQDEYVSVSNKKMLVKLHAEVLKLRAITAFTKADAEEKLASQKESMEAMIMETESELKNSEEEYKCVRAEIAEKEGIIRSDQKNHDLADEELTHIEINNEEIYEELNKTIKERDKCKEEHERMERLIESVQGKLNEIFVRQKQIAITSKEMDDMLKRQSDTRMGELYTFLEEEGNRRKQAIEKKKIGGDTTINDVIEKQRTSMQSLCESLDNATNSTFEDISLLKYSGFDVKKSL